MPLFIPLIAAGAATATTAAGWWWWTSDEKEEPTFSGELFDILKPILIVALIILGLRWLYKQGGTVKKAK